MIRIGFASFSAGDSPEAARALALGGPLDYLLLEGGRECVQAMPGLLADVRGRGTRIIALVREGSPRKAADVLKAAGVSLPIAVVAGGHLETRLPELAGGGLDLPSGVVSVRAMAGATVLAAALETGPEIVLAGGCMVESMTAAAALHRFGWTSSDYGLLAGAVLAGRILAAGPVACGGGSNADWETMENPAAIDGPVVELEPDGTFAVLRHARSGGVVSRANLLEALLDGIGDPGQIRTPECMASLTELVVHEGEQGRVTIRHAQGSEPEGEYALVRRQAGHRVTALVVFPAPAALQKAYGADRILRERIARHAVPVEEIHAEYAGGGDARAEVVWRVGIRCSTPAAAQRAGREVQAAIRRGPPGGVLPSGAGGITVEEVLESRLYRIPSGLARWKVEVA